jgi:AAA domain
MPILNDPFTFPWSELIKQPRRETLVDNLLHSSGLSTLVAPSTGGKTTLAHGLARTVMTGGEWGGKRIEQRPVLWIAGEDKEGLVDLDLAWDRAFPDHDKSNSEFRVEPYNFFDTSDHKKIADALKGQQRWLIVCDSLADFIGHANEKEAADMNRVYGNLYEIVKANNSTLLMLHHTGWLQDREKGTVAIRNKSDAMPQITKFDPGRGIVTLKHNKWRGGRKLLSFSYEVRLIAVPGRPQAIPIVTGKSMSTLEVSLDEPRLSKPAQRAYDILLDHPDGLTWARWRDTWQAKTPAGEGNGRTTFSRARDELQDAGLIEKHGEGQGAVYTVPKTVPPSHTYRSMGRDGTVYGSHRPNGSGLGQSGTVSDQGNGMDDAELHEFEDWSHVM